MTVIHREERASWPFFNLLELGLDYIQNDRNSVFVIIPDDSLMGVGRIAAHHSILFAGKLGRVVRGHVPVDLVLFHFHVLLLLLHGHDETSVGHQLIVTFRLLKRFLPLFLALAGALSLNLVVTAGWWLRVTWLLALRAAALRLGATSCSAGGSSSLFLSVVLRILILSVLIVLRSSRLVSHA